jgi:cytochrome c553
MYPIPLAVRKTPPVMPTECDPKLGDEGEFFVSDIYESHFAMPQSRPIKELRVYQVLPKGSTHIVNQPRIGHANAESARMLLGTVPVESDGSAYFRAPARKPLYFQAVDAAGHAVQSMRSITYLQPGERRGCVGCHERRGAASSARPRTIAMKRAASVIEPGPEGTYPFNFQLLVQPVLDEHCVRCHDGSKGENKSKPVLTGQPQGEFTRSYNGLRPYVRWYEWGGASITEIVTRPGNIGADVSRLSKVLVDDTHSKHVNLSKADRERISIWLDGNVPFYGTYDEDAQKAQRMAKKVGAPALQ